MDALIIAGGWFIGSVIVALLGWMQSGQPFIARTFCSTILSGIGGAILFGLAYNHFNNALTIYDILAAVAAGMGIGAGVSRVSGAIVANLKVKA